MQESRYNLLNRHQNGPSPGSVGLETVSSKQNRKQEYTPDRPTKHSHCRHRNHQEGIEAETSAHGSRMVKYVA